MLHGFAPDLFADRTAIVTGAARGIGAATARGLAALGATVAICDRRDDELQAVAAAIAADGHDVVAVRGDVRDAADVALFLADVHDRLSRVDVLVNNAGGSFHAPFADTSEKGEQMLIAENFTQATRLIRNTLGLMPAGASIVNVTSVEAHQASPGFAIYGAMKAALANLTRSLALELGPRGIRVNAVAPDAVMTEGEADSRGDVAGMADVAPTFRPATEPPVGMTGDPADAAAAITFLASPLARFITGTTLHVDGGTHAAGGWHRVWGDTAH